MLIISAWLTAIFWISPILKFPLDLVQFFWTEILWKISHVSWNCPDIVNFSKISQYLTKNSYQNWIIWDNVWLYNEMNNGIWSPKNILEQPHGWPCVSSKSYHWIHSKLTSLINNEILKHKCLMRDKFQVSLWKWYKGVVP